MKGTARLTRLTTFIVVLIGWSNAAPSTVRSRSLFEEVSIGHSSDTDLKMPSRQTTLVAPASTTDALSEKNISEVGDWEQQDRKMMVEIKAYEVPIDVLTVSILRSSCYSPKVPQYDISSTALFNIYIYSLRAPIYLVVVPFLIYMTFMNVILEEVQPQNVVWMKVAYL